MSEYGKIKFAQLLILLGITFYGFYLQRKERQLKRWSKGQPTPPASSRPPQGGQHHDERFKDLVNEFQFEAESILSTPESRRAFLHCADRLQAVLAIAIEEKSSEVGKK